MYWCEKLAESFHAPKSQCDYGGASMKLGYLHINGQCKLLCHHVACHVTALNSISLFAKAKPETLP